MPMARAGGTARGILRKPASGNSTLLQMAGLAAPDHVSMPTAKEHDPSLPPSLPAATAAVPLELWGGYECTVNRVGDAWYDQTPRSGHEHRIEDLALFAGL